MLHPLAIDFPNISPVALSWGPLEIRWYGLAYATGLGLGWLYVRRLIATPGLWPPDRKPIAADLATDLLLCATIGVVVGGRLGEVLLYEPYYYWQHPAEIPQIWRGGMAFHGGLVGTGLALLVLARMRNVSTLTLIDLCAAAAPIGLGFGRLANFVNGELWGRVSTVPWAMVFPDGGPLPRHPSQIYEALTEGVLVFLVLWYAIYGRLSLRRPGTVMGLFLAGYGLARIVCEHFREDTDPQIGLGLVTSGQMYSIPMILAGIGLFIWAQRARATPSGSATVGKGSVA